MTVVQHCWSRALASKDDATLSVCRQQAITARQQGMYQPTTLRHFHRVWQQSGHVKDWLHYLSAGLSADSAPRQGNHLTAASAMVATLEARCITGRTTPVCPVAAGISAATAGAIRLADSTITTAGPAVATLDATLPTSSSYCNCWK